MKYFRTLTAAAGAIALAATIGLTRDARESDDAFRVDVVARDASGGTDDIPANLLPIAIDSETGKVYFAKISRRDTTAAASLPPAKES